MTRTPEEYFESAKKWASRAQQFRALHNHLAAINAYLHAIAEAEAAKLAGYSVDGVHEVLSAWHDNVGNAYADSGNYDDAISNYAAAFRYQRHPAVLHNWANALKLLGEYRSALQKNRQLLTECQSNQNVDPMQLAKSYDNMATVFFQLGDHVEALRLLGMARSMFKENDLESRAVNLLIEARVHMETDAEHKAAHAFQQAHDLIFKHYRKLFKPDWYRRGFKASLAKRLPFAHQAHQMLRQAISLLPGEQSVGLLECAADLALANDDQALALRIMANLAAQLGDMGNIDAAMSLSSQVSTKANQLGLARPESMAIGTRASLMMQGAEDRMYPLGSFGAFAHVRVLNEINEKVVAQFISDPFEIQFETLDTGVTENQLAKLATDYGAHKLAANYFRIAIDKIAHCGPSKHLVNRLSGLRQALESLNNCTEMADVVKKLEALLRGRQLSMEGRLIAHRALGRHYGKINLKLAIFHMKEACNLAEKMREDIEPGVGRTDLSRQRLDIPYVLSEYLREDKMDKEAFEALQHAKGRRHIDIVAARHRMGNDILDYPPALKEVRQLLASLGRLPSTVLVDLAVTDEGVSVYVVTQSSVKSFHIAGSTKALAKEVFGDVREREARLISLCIENPLLQKIVEQVSDVAIAGQHILIVPDKYLISMPLHVIPINGKPWCESASISYIPAVALLRFASSAPFVARNFLIAGDSRGDLPGAEAECRLIGEILGTDTLIGPQCTRSAIEQALRNADLVHLAVHGRGDPLHGRRSSLLLADGNGGTEWVAFEALASFVWKARLVVFSGCSTGVVGTRHGSDALSVATAAMEAGVPSVVACLWPVEDEDAKLFMTTFYTCLNEARKDDRQVVDLREILDVARESLRGQLTVERPSSKRRDGRDFHLDDVEEERTSANTNVSDVLSWGPFVLFGKPIVELNT